MKKCFPILILAVVLGMIKPGPASEKDESEDQWQHQLKKYGEIYSLVKQHYQGPVDMEKFFFASIRGFLNTLDPHSYFLDPAGVRALNEDQQGNYFGIGTRISKYEDRLTVITSLAGSPAYQLGIMAGDVIAEIEGKDTRNLSIDESMKLLRGAKDTYVTIKIRREGIEGLIPFRIKRVEIPLNSISYSFVFPWAPGIGYISIRTFGNTTAAEFQESLKHLSEDHDLKALVLDLRGNAGGSLYGAIDVADFFLEKGKIIVSLKGRTIDRQFTAQKNNQYENVPLVVLINRGSASASEIVASALRDNQRALIIGARSWGKGLVQTISRLSLNTSLAITTAKYYTPLNKCLQRDFQEMDDYLYFLDTDDTDYETNTAIEGGVIPDIAILPRLYPEPIVNLISRGAFFEFGRHLTEGGWAITRDFKADQKIIAEFENFLKNKKIPYDSDTLKTYSESIQEEIEREVLSNTFSPEEGVKVFLKRDPVTQKAIEVLKNKYD